MFKNLKLSTKIAAGFFGLVLLMVALGSLAIVNMRTVRTDSNKLSREYVPQVSIANELERDSLMTMFNMRGYMMMQDKSYLVNGRKFLGEVHSDIKDAQELAAKSTHLAALKSNTEKANAAAKDYEVLVNESEKSYDGMAVLKTTLNETATKFMENSTAFLKYQQEAMLTDIKDKKTPDKLEERFQRNMMMNEVIGLVDAARIAVWKSLAFNDIKAMDDAQKLFPVIDKKLDEIRAATHQDANLKLLDETNASVARYLKTMNEYHDLVAKQSDIDKRRLKASDDVLVAAKETAAKGIDETKNIANEAATSLGRSLWIMIFGLLTAMVAGVGLAYSVTKAVSRPLKKAVDGIKSATSQVSSAALQLTSTAEQLSSGANEQTSSIQEISASLEEMSGMVQENVTNARNASDLSNQVMSISGRGNESMEGLQRAMHEILESNNKIEHLVKVIGEIGEKTKVMDEIVFQTKLLSFNASVEAERAGEHGRGFAVVAQEVGNLAQMSGKAAQEIAQILSTSIKEAETITTENKRKVETGHNLVSETAKSLREIATSASRVAEGSSQVLTASEQQATGIKQINSAMSILDKSTQENAATAEETASTSEELNTQADSLNTMVLSLVELMDGHKETGTASTVASVRQKKIPMPTPEKKPIIQKLNNVHPIVAAKRTASKTEVTKSAVGSDIQAPGPSDDGWDKL